LVHLPDEVNIDDVLTYYMGKNTPERQEFIIDNLKVSLDHLPDSTHPSMPEEVVEDAEIS
jgi:topoisomerase-4 subunit B